MAVGPLSSLLDVPRDLPISYQVGFQLVNVATNSPIFALFQYHFVLEISQELNGRVALLVYLSKTTVGVLLSTVVFTFLFWIPPFLMARFLPLDVAGILGTVLSVTLALIAFIGFRTQSTKRAFNERKISDDKLRIALGQEPAEKK